MTLRDTLVGNDAHVHDRLDEVLDSADAVVVLANSRGVTTYLHGFAVSGCQLEMPAVNMESAMRHLGSRNDDVA
jgi:hypothetical protein